MKAMEAITVGELRKRLSNPSIGDSMPVVFQGNTQGEEDSEDEATYTICTGMVFSAFVRTGRKHEFVIDAKITDSES